MDRNLIILLSVFVLLALTFIIWLLTDLFIIMPRQIKQIKESLKQQEEGRRQIEIKLNEKLINFCNMFKIPLEYKEDLGKAAGHIIYHQNGFGRMFLDDCKIEVINEYKDRPWVLAHELGHYIAINKLQNNTEEMADQCAGELCCMLLSEQEQKDLATALDIRFGVKIA